jgi:hypothetical protein
LEERVAAHAQVNRNESASATTVSMRPDALLQIDQNRASVVDKIVESWKGEIPAAQIGSFRSKLSALRADQLLAANLSGSFDGVLELVNRAELAVQGSNGLSTSPASTVHANAVNKERAKALGDTNRDLVYTPVTPCRFFDSRNAVGGKILGGSSRDYFTFASSFQSQGGLATNCNIDLGAVALAINVVVVNQEGGGFATVYAAGTTLPAASHINFPSAAIQPEANFGIFPICTTGCPSGKGISVYTSTTTDALADVVGYFKAPGGVIGDITEIQTAAGSGLTGGTASGVATLALANTYKLPQACANGQVAKYNTSTLVWECSNDLQGTGGGGAGTVTNIATGAGLSGGPITSTGTINLASTQLLPTTACAANQIPKWNGSSWACAADATGASGGSGTVTSVATGAGLTGGPITAAGTIGLAASQLLPTTACADSQTLIWNATSSNWICAGWTPPSAVANAFVNGGNSFGADAVLGTNDANRLFIKSGNTMSFYAPESFFLQSGSTSPSRSGFTQIYSSGIENFYASPSEVRVATEKGRIEVVDKFNTVNIRAGSIFNQAGNASKGQTISGGGELTDNCLSQSQTTYGASCTNQTNGDFAVVSGGAGNSAREGYATVSGGSSNRALGSASVVSGGFGNTANAVGSVVAGGQLNTAGSSITTGIGDNSFVAGGTKNYTQGYASFAAGERAKAFHDNSFVWGGSGVDTNSAGVGTFTAYAPGGFYFFRGSVGAGGCVLPAGVVSWSCTSDRATKSNIQALNPLDTLRRVVAMPVARWNYIGTEKIKNVGPMAQDFFKAFSLGDSDKTIASMNMSGVALSAIQGLNQKLTEQVKTKDAEISALKARLQAIEKKLGL